MLMIEFFKGRSTWYLHTVPAEGVRHAQSTNSSASNPDLTTNMEWIDEIHRQVAVDATTGYLKIPNVNR